MTEPGFLGRKYFPELDGLRAIAAWTVVAYHLGVQGIPGSYGVVLFFVLSGFLITLLLLREHDRTGRIDLKGFYVRRTLRIMPAFYGYLAFATLWKLARGNPVDWEHLGWAATYTVNYYNAFFGDPNSGYSHAWSLAIEEQFYLLWPFVFYSAIRRRGLAKGLVVAIAVVWIVRTLLRLATDIPQSYFYASLEMRADSLLVGALLAVLFVRMPARATVPLRVVSAPVLLFGGLLAIVALARMEFAYGQVFRDTVTAALLPVLCALVILGALATNGAGDGTVEGRRTVLAHPVMVWLGRISYSTYLYQQMVPGWGTRIIPSAPRAAQFALECAIVLVLACGSFYLVERPALRLKERFTQRREGPGGVHPVIQGA